jgi:hypothetical protein
VQDPSRVRRLQTLAHLHPDLDRETQRQRPEPQPLAKRLPLQKLEDDVRLALPLPHVEQREHVRVRQHRHRPRLVLEPPQSLRARPPLRRDHLHRDVSPQPRVPRPVDLPHPPRPDEAEDLVRPEMRPRRNEHALLR